MRKICSLLLFIISTVNASAYHDWKSTIFTGEWMEETNWKPNTLPTLTSTISRIPSYDPVPGTFYHIRVSPPGGAEANGIWLGNSSTTTTRLDVASSLTINGGITVYQNGILSVTNEGTMVMSAGLSVTGLLDIHTGGSVTSKSFTVSYAGDDWTPEAVMDGGTLHVTGADGFNRWYQQGIAIGVNNTNPFTGRMVINDGLVDLPAMGMARYANKQAELTVNGGTLRVRGEADGLVAGVADTSIVNIEVHGGLIDIQNYRQFSVGGRSRVLQTGGKVQTGTLSLSGEAVYEIRGGELLLNGDEFNMTTTNTRFRLVGPEPEVTWNGMVFNASGGLQYLFDRSMPHIAPIQMTMELRRPNILEIGLPGGVLFSATNHFVLINYTYGSRDDTPQATPELWTTDWTENNNERCAVTMTGIRGTVDLDAEHDLVFSPTVAGAVVVTNLNIEDFPGGLPVELDIESVSTNTLDDFAASLSDAGYTDVSNTAGASGLLRFTIPPENLVPDSAYFAWDFTALPWGATNALVSRVRFGASPGGPVVVVE